MRPQSPQSSHSYEQHRLIQRANRYLEMAEQARDQMLIDAYRDEADACLRLAQIDGSLAASPPHAE